MTELLGERPTELGRSRDHWEHSASLIETVRHRNGLDPADGITSRSITGVIGGPPEDFSARVDWQGAARTVEHLLDADVLERNDLRHQALRLRR